MNINIRQGVSVVICCYNSSELIVPTLRALANQKIYEGMGYEIILVDNNCSDNTIQRAQNYWKSKKHELKIVKEEKLGIIFARQKGVKHAQYDIILFVDDDNILDLSWISKLYKLYSKMPTVGAIGGYSEPLIKNGTLPPWFLKYQAAFACGPQRHYSGVLTKKKDFLYGAGISFRSKVIKDIFSSKIPLFLTGRTKNIFLRGDDSEICFRCALMGWDIYYDESLRLRHNIASRRLLWENVCSMRKGGGIARPILDGYLSVINKKKPSTIWKLFCLILINWGKFIIKPNNLFNMKSEGSESSFRFYFLFGFTQSIMKRRELYREFEKKLGCDL